MFIGRKNELAVLNERYVNEYMGLVFEQMCRDWLMYDVPPDDLPVMLVDIGQWWGTSSKLKKEIQIDIVGVSLIITETVKKQLTPKAPNGCLFW